MLPLVEISMISHGDNVLTLVSGEEATSFLNRPDFSKMLALHAEATAKWGSHRVQFSHEPDQSTFADQLRDLITTECHLKIWLGIWFWNRHFRFDSEWPQLWTFGLDGDS